MAVLPPQRERAAPALWTVLAEFPLFVLRLFVHPRQLVRALDWDEPATLRRVALYVLIWLAILVWALGDNRPLADTPEPALSTFKGVVLKAHHTSWDWLETPYSWLNTNEVQARRLWDILLTRGFLCYTFFAALLATAVVARLRMWRYGLSWKYALGTALLGYLGVVSCLSLSLVPLALLFICRHCWLRAALFVLLNLAGWTYLGYFTLADLGERPRSWLPQVTRSLGYGLLQYVIAYVIFFVLIAAVIPL